MSASLQELREKIAASCRILAMEGLVDGILGHVSVRVPETNEMLIRCRGNQENGVRYTKADAIRLVDFDGNGSDLMGMYHVPKELSIHGETYKSRPEVGCVIHAHPPDALICGITQLEFRPVFGAFNIPAMRMALEGIPVFPRSCLITRSDLAQAMLEIMGDKNICLMKGHGITVTGQTVEEATVRALNFNILAKVTMQVAQTGREAAPISQEDINELPDLGSQFNDYWAWRYYVKKLHEEERGNQ
ncbi:class II aldolase/adducin family protein [Aneurinibacillus tyrosinisolvens]|uniref:class II aldolase/adducin family protein n=1 Tax=Aneurinibacillus tyrosinisolvens TaxID=1443435 RepID=UPI00063FD05E|nr:class II aldolase/adducin family protein [Aneurinibacillus tyrosinisolvens]